MIFLLLMLGVVCVFFFLFFLWFIVLCFVFCLGLSGCIFCILHFVIVCPSHVWIIFVFWSICCSSSLFHVRLTLCRLHGASLFLNFSSYCFVFFLCSFVGVFVYFLVDYGSSVGPFWLLASVGSLMRLGVQ